MMIKRIRATTMIDYLVQRLAGKGIIDCCGAVGDDGFSAMVRSKLSISEFRLAERFVSVPRNSFRDASSARADTETFFAGRSSSTSDLEILMDQKNPFPLGDTTGDDGRSIVIEQLALRSMRKVKPGSEACPVDS